MVFLSGLLKRYRSSFEYLSKAVGESGEHSLLPNSLRQKTKLASVLGIASSMAIGTARRTANCSRPFAGSIHNRPSAAAQAKYTAKSPNAEINSLFPTLIPGFCITFELTKPPFLATVTLNCLSMSPHTLHQSACPMCPSGSSGDTIPISHIPSRFRQHLAQPRSTPSNCPYATPQINSKQPLSYTAAICHGVAMPHHACPFPSHHQATKTPPRSGQPACPRPRVNRPRSLTHPPRRLTLSPGKLTLSAPSLTLLPRKLTLFGEIARTVSDVSTPRPRRRARSVWHVSTPLLAGIAARRHRCHTVRTLTTSLPGAPDA